MSNRPNPPFAVSSSRPRSRKPNRMPHLVRLTGTAACAAVAIAPSIATADVARLEPVTKTKPGERSAGYRIVVTDQRGARRTFGPVPSGRLVAAPDGRHLAVVPGDEDDASAAPSVVPLDGSPPRRLQLPAGTAVSGELSQIGWTPDGTEQLVGDAVAWDPSVLANPYAIKDLDRLRWTALRCSVATAVCTELPAPNGLAVGVPDGILTTSSLISSFPMSWVFEGLGEKSLPEWERPTSRRGRAWIGIANDDRVASTQLVGPPPTTLERVHRTGAAGLPAAVAAIGGPAGAVVSRVTFVTELERRRGRVRLKSRIRSPRFLLAKTGTPLRAFASRPITLPRRDRRRIDKGTARPGQRLHFHPRFATADGWVGGGGATPDPGDTAVLATMDPDGRVRPVTVQGRSATAWALLRAVHWHSPGRVTDPIEIVGYEATGSLIVTIHYQPPSNSSPGDGDTLRVPLNGKGRPTIVRGRVDVAW